MLPCVARGVGEVMTYAAVVVSFNRIELLKQCLDALENQTRALDEIIVVDNGSTDGSPEYVAQEHPNVTCFRTEENLGGAGGFAWGVDIALAHGHDAAWLMDDDACPETDAVEPLISLFESTDPKPVFLASLVVTERDKFNVGNFPGVSSDAEKQILASNIGGIAIDTATFVGVMINLHVARQTHLPLDDFFIWMDDAEYTYRLSRKGLAVVIPSSQVNHPANKPGSNDMAGRLFYFVRNKLWFVRERPHSLGDVLLETQRLAWTCIRQLLAAKDKGLWARSVSRGVWQGVIKRPRHKQPGSLVGTLSDEQRTAIGC